MPNKNYKAGVRLEYKRKAYYEAEGFAVIRASGSHGLFDLVCLRADTIPLVVSCKRVQSDTDARALLRRFNDNPPFPPTRKFRQAMEVSVKGRSEIQRVEV